MRETADGSSCPFPAGAVVSGAKDELKRVILQFLAVYKRRDE